MRSRVGCGRGTGATSATPPQVPSFEVTYSLSLSPPIHERGVGPTRIRSEQVSTVAAHVGRDPAALAGGRRGDRLAGVSFDSEEDLYAPVKAFLEGQGYDDDEEYGELRSLCEGELIEDEVGREHQKAVDSADKGSGQQVAVSPLDDRVYREKVVTYDRVADGQGEHREESRKPYRRALEDVAA